MHMKTKGNNIIKANFLCSATEWDSIMLRLKRTANKALKDAGLILKIPFDCEITVNLSDDEELKKLNTLHMGKNKPTNVLSFPQFSLKNGNFRSFKNKLNSPNKRIYLGDIAVSYQRVYSESYEQSKSFKDHFVHLIIHSFLHLCGFDHLKEKEAEVMERLEIKILEKLGIKNPY